MPQARPSRMTRAREMAMFGLRKAFVTPAPRPMAPNGRMKGFFGPGLNTPNQWLPE